MRIYIPTYRRPGAQHTFNALSPYWRERTTLVLDAWDARVMANWLNDNDAAIWIPPENIQTIAAKRAWIIENAQEEKIVMMDDDLRFAVRVREDDKIRLRPAGGEQVEYHLHDLEKRLDHFVHAGFSARQGNNRLPAGWRSPARMMYILGYRPEILREECELGRIETREDFDYTLQLLRKGLANSVTADICVDQKYNAKGGCSEDRTVEASNADADRLVELHPGFVKIVEKDYKSSVPRREVTIQWKRALEAGRAGS